VGFNGTAGYGTVRPVVWEDGGREPASYPIDWLTPSVKAGSRHLWRAGWYCKKAAPGYQALPVQLAVSAMLSSFDDIHVYRHSMACVRSKPMAAQ
jgi:hypothetical protein